MKDTLIMSSDTTQTPPHTYKERASEASSLLVDTIESMILCDMSMPALEVANLCKMSYNTIIYVQSIKWGILH